MTSLFDKRPLLVALAGPNGAGKSTFYQAHLRQSGLPFVNADDLARQFKLKVYPAAELAGRIRSELVERRESYIFETVLSDPVGEKVEFLQKAMQSGYTVVLIFIGIANADISEERVTLRVIKGGHDVPDGKLQSRYGRTIANLRRAFVGLPNVLVYDNSDLRTPYRLVAEQIEGHLKTFHSVPSWLKPLLPSR